MRNFTYSTGWNIAFQRNMSLDDTSMMMAQLAELRTNRDDADVTLNCQGDVILAHSLILSTRCVHKPFILYDVNFTTNRGLFSHCCCLLFYVWLLRDLLLRSEYFKAALNTSVGNNNKVLKVDECSPRILAAVVDFIYGIAIPEDIKGDFEDAKTLLAMADLYLMEDLKDTVGALIATKHMRLPDILEVSQVAEKYRAQKLKEMCCKTVFKNIKLLDKKLLMELYEVLPLGEKAWLEVIDGRAENGIMDIAIKVLGINLDKPFKRRREFQSEDGYLGYLRAQIKPNMLVCCNKSSMWKGGNLVTEGVIGRVTSIDPDVKVKWPMTSSLTAGVHLVNLDLITPPIASYLLND